MISKAARKVPGGKMLKLEIAHNETTISSVKIMGDFLLYPEDALPALESVLQNTPLDSSVASIKEKLDAAVKNSNAQLVGFTTSDVAETIVDGVSKVGGVSR